MGDMAVRTEGLTKHFGDVVALDHLDFEVAPGEVVGYLGPNGAGKTTTIRLLLGLAQPSAGRCEVFGLDCQRQPVDAHRRLAFVTGEANLWPSLTGAETLHLFGRIHGQVDVAYRDELIDRFDLDPNKKVRAYSKGNRQKVILIGALMVRPDLLVLDEPTSGLDPLMEQAFRHCIREARDRGQSVFLSSHSHERGRGTLRPRGHPAGWEADRERHVGRDAPPQRGPRRGDVRWSRARYLGCAGSEFGGDGRACPPQSGQGLRRAAHEGSWPKPASPSS